MTSKAAIEAAKRRVDACARQDGGLHSLGWYLDWLVGEADATLDGEFTAAELRAIADHMDSLNAQAQKDRP